MKKEKVRFLEPVKADAVVRAGVETMIRELFNSPAMCNGQFTRREINQINTATEFLNRLLTDGADGKKRKIFVESKQLS